VPVELSRVMPSQAVLSVGGLAVVPAHSSTWMVLSAGKPEAEMATLWPSVRLVCGVTAATGPVTAPAGGEVPTPTMRVAEATIPKPPTCRKRPILDTTVFTVSPPKDR
jgi:hypothetical protein